MWSRIARIRPVYPKRKQRSKKKKKRQICVIGNPPYSPDLVPCDFFLFSEVETGKSILQCYFSIQKFVTSVNEHSFWRQVRIYCINRKRQYFTKQIKYIPRFILCTNHFIIFYIYLFKTSLINSPHCYKSTAVNALTCFLYHFAMQYFSKTVFFLVLFTSFLYKIAKLKVSKEVFNTLDFVFVVGLCLFYK